MSSSSSASPKDLLFLWGCSVSMVSNNVNHWRAARSKVEGMVWSGEGPPSRLFGSDKQGCHSREFWSNEEEIGFVRARRFRGLDRKRGQDRNAMNGVAFKQNGSNVVFVTIRSAVVPFGYRGFEAKQNGDSTSASLDSSK